ncbi:MAG: alpha amylase C-terminal domain-containing protein, partial [Coprococcus sp.]
RNNYKAVMSDVSGYAAGASGIVALSHDEVAYDKGSFIEKMYGGYEDKYADLRVLYGLYMTMPGHKLIFMGQEIGLFGGFTGNAPIDWSMLEFDANKYLQKYVKDLNKLYQEEPLLYISESEHKAVEFYDDVETHMAVFKRGTGEPGNSLYVICNFGIQNIKDYRLKVDKDGKYKELISSDNVKYGGEGNNNRTAKNSANGEIVINVPALSISIIKRTI